MKFLFILLFLFASKINYANMASPIYSGTFTSTIYSSIDIDIRKEKIEIVINEDFSEAKYKIIYYLYSEEKNKKLPLVFYAKDIKGNLSVFYEGEIVNCYDYDKSNHKINNLKSNLFSNFIDTNFVNTKEYFNDEYNLKYFELLLKKGESVITIEYTARVWTDVSDWTKKYYFRYSLSPARLWKSFSNLEIIIDNRNFAKEFRTNLREPDIGKTDSIAIWYFRELPSDELLISYQPLPNKIAKILIDISPAGLTIILAVLLFIIHLFFIVKSRRKNLSKKLTKAVWIGSLLIPIIALIFYPLIYSIIYQIIGASAGREQIYSFLVIFLYPIFLLIYFIVILFFDFLVKLFMKHKLNYDR